MLSQLPIPDALKVRRRFVYGLGLLDLTVVVLLLFNHFLHTTVPTVSGFAMALNLSTHFYIWAGTWILDSDMISVSLVFYILAIYVVAFWVDIGAAIARSFGPGGLFGWFTFVLGLIFIAIDLLQIFATFGLAYKTKRLRQKMLKAIDALMDSNIRSQKLYKVERWTYRFRQFISVTWKFQLFFVIITLFQFFLGLVFSISFGLIMLLEIPHVFIWIWAWSVAGSPKLYPFDAITDQGYLLLYIIVFSVTLVLSVTASVARLVLLIMEILNPSLAPPLWRSVLILFGWFALLFGIGLAIVAGIEVYTTYQISKGIGEDFERTKEWSEYISKVMKKIEEIEDEEDEEE